MSSVPRARSGATSSDWVQRKRDERMRVLIRAAAEVFAKRGYDGTNMEEIGSRMGMRGPSLYHYASSKEDLFLKCVETINAEVVGRLTELAEGEGQPLERLHRLFREQVLFETVEYRDYLPLFLQVYLPDSALRERVAELRRGHGEIFARVAREAVAAGEISDDNSHRNLLLAIGAIAYVRDWYQAHGPETPEALADDIATRLVSGLLGGSAAD